MTQSEQRCTRCGHLRSKHHEDGSCQHTTTSDGRAYRCPCPRFQPAEPGPYHLAVDLDSEGNVVGVGEEPDAEVGEANLFAHEPVDHEEGRAAAKAEMQRIRDEARPSTEECEHRNCEIGMSPEEVPDIWCYDCEKHLVVLRADVVGEVVGDLRSLLETGPRDGYDLGIEDVVGKLEAM